MGKHKIISMIACIDEAGGLGYNDPSTNTYKLLHKDKTDMMLFVETTLHKPIIMGYRTWLSLGRRPLHDRYNLVLGRECKEDKKALVEIDESPQKLLWRALNVSDEVVIIGGTKVYSAFHHICTRLYITHIHHTFKEANVFHDAFCQHKLQDMWHCKSSKEIKKSKYNKYHLSICIYERW